jgi:hypothetical protein
MPMARRKEPLPRIRRDDEVQKRTLGLSNGVHKRLAFEAARRGATKSRIAEEVLDRELPHVKVDESGRPVAQGQAVA